MQNFLEVKCFLIKFCTYLYKKKLKYIWKINVTRMNTFMNGQKMEALKRSGFFRNLFVAFGISSFILNLKSSDRYKSLSLE